MVGFFGRVLRETENDRSGRISISNWPFIRARKSLSGVAKRCIGSTMDERSRRVGQSVAAASLPSLG